MWQGTFLPFGEELNPQAAVSSVKFTGKQWDAETGLDYFGARYYSGTGGTSGNGASIGPDLGRFLTPDWSAGAKPVDCKRPSKCMVAGGMVGVVK